MREIYFKIKQKSDLPVSILTYSYKDFDDVIHPFKNICVNFKDDEENIKQMISIKEKYGVYFMFFNNSDEGIDFWKNNPINIVTNRQVNGKNKI